MTGVVTTGGFSLTGDQYRDVTLNNVTASANLTVNIAGSGSMTASMNTGSALSLTKALGSGETAVLQFLVVQFRLL